VEVAVLIPIKSFREAKKRLSPALTADERLRLARWMAERVIAAARPLPTFVACDDDDVAAWAQEQGADVSWSPGLGLNGAIDLGIKTVSNSGIDHVIISHGDLPLAEGLPTVFNDGQIVIVPDRRRAGTNVLSRPCHSEMTALYGPGSFHRHFDAATSTGLPVSVRFDSRLSIDIDTIEDCRHPLIAPLLRPMLGDAL
jgi:2-phospho-L-lactate guanylyltransferase